MMTGTPGLLRIAFEAFGECGWMRSGEYGQTCYTLRRSDRQGPSEMAAPVVTNKVEALNSNLVHNPQSVLDQLVEGIGLTLLAPEE
jgi:hypothetical protein